jgi:hypothetical protein
MKSGHNSGNTTHTHRTDTKFQYSSVWCVSAVLFAPRVFLATDYYYLLLNLSGLWVGVRVKANPNPHPYPYPATDHYANYSTKLNQ